MSDVPVGDVDPEDAWDDGDSVEDKLAVLDRVVTALREHDERFEFRRRDALRLLGKIADEADPEIVDRLRAALEAL